MPLDGYGKAQHQENLIPQKSDTPLLGTALGLEGRNLVEKLLGLQFHELGIKDH